MGSSDRARHFIMLAGLSGVVFISLAGMVSTLSNSDKCSPNSLHMSDTDCHVFYHCSMYGRPITKSCGQLMFNDLDKVCDWPANVMKYRPECDPDKKQMVVSNKIEDNDVKIEATTDVLKNEFTKPKKNRQGQREINLEPQQANSIFDKNEFEKKMKFVPGIQQPEMSLESLPKLEKDTAREQKEISSHESQAVPVSYIQEKQGSNTRWTVSRVRPVTPDQAKISKKQPRKLGMKKDVTKIWSGESKKSKVRSSRRFFIRNNNKALRKRRQFLRSKEINRTQATEKS